MRNDATLEYRKGRRNLHLRKAKELDALSEKLDIPRNVVIDLLVDYFGEPLAHALDVARSRAKRATTPDIIIPQPKS